MRTSQLLIPTLLLLQTLSQSTYLYFDNSSPPSPNQDGSSAFPYSTFTQALPSISNNLNDADITFIFVPTEQPYPIDLTPTLSGSIYNTSLTFTSPVSGLNNFDCSRFPYVRPDSTISFNQVTNLNIQWSYIGISLNQSASGFTSLMMAPAGVFNFDIDHSCIVFNTSGISENAIYPPKWELSGYPMYFSMTDIVITGNFEDFITNLFEISTNGPNNTNVIMQNITFNATLTQVSSFDDMLVFTGFDSFMGQDISITYTASGNDARTTQLFGIFNITSTNEILLTNLTAAFEYSESSDGDLGIFNPVTIFNFGCDPNVTLSSFNILTDSNTSATVLTLNNNEDPCYAYQSVMYSSVIIENGVMNGPVGALITMTGSPDNVNISNITLNNYETSDIFFNLQLISNNSQAILTFSDIQIFNSELSSPILSVSAGYIDPYGNYNPIYDLITPFTVVFSNLEFVNNNVNNTGGNPGCLFLSQGVDLIIANSTFMANKYFGISLILEQNSPVSYFILNSTFTNETYILGATLITNLVPFQTQFNKVYVDTKGLYYRSLMISNSIFTEILVVNSTFIQSNSPFTLLINNIFEDITVLNGFLLGAYGSVPIPQPYPDRNNTAEILLYGNIPSFIAYLNNSFTLCGYNCYFALQSGNSFNNISLPSGSLINFPNGPNAISSLIVQENLFLNIESMTSNLINVLQTAGDIFILDNIMNNISTLVLMSAQDANLNLTLSGNLINNYTGNQTVYDSASSLYLILRNISNNVVVNSIHSVAIFDIDLVQTQTIVISSNLIESCPIISSPPAYEVNVISIEVSYTYNSTDTYLYNNLITNIPMTNFIYMDGYSPEEINDIIYISVQGTSGITIEGLVITNVYTNAVYSALMLLGATTISMSDSLINGNIFENSTSHIFLIGGSTITFQNVTLSGNTMTPPELIGLNSKAIVELQPMEMASTTAMTLSLYDFTLDGNIANYVDESDFADIIVTCADLQMNAVNTSFLNAYTNQLGFSIVNISLSFVNTQFQPRSDTNFMSLFFGNGGVGSFVMENFAVNSLETAELPLIVLEGNVNLSISLSNLSISACNLIEAEDLGTSMIEISDLYVSDCSLATANFLNVEGSQIDVSIQNAVLTNIFADEGSFFQLSLNSDSTPAFVINNMTLYEVTLDNLIAFVGSELPDMINISTVIGANMNFCFLSLDSQDLSDLSELSSQVEMSDLLMSAFIGNLINSDVTIEFGLNNAVFSDLQDPKAEQSGFVLLQAGGTMQSDNVIISNAQSSNQPLMMLTNMTSVQISNWTLVNILNSGYQGNILIENSQVEISDSILFAMQNFEVPGGAFILTNSTYEIANSMFMYDLGTNGGALYFNNSNGTILQANFSSNNAFLSGNNQSTQPVALLMNISLDMNMTENPLSMYYIYQLLNFTSEAYIVFNASSALMSETQYIFYYVDGFGQLVNFTSLNMPFLIGNSINSTNAINIVNSKFNCTNGYCYLQGANFLLSNTSNFGIYQISSLFLNLILNVTIQFQLRECLPGEYLDPITNLCELCGLDYYSVNPSDSCSICPNANVTCLGGDIIDVNPGYWRAPQTGVILQCIKSNPPRCIGGYNVNEQCETGYAGALCQSCDYTENYSAGSDDSCVPCSTNVVKMLIEVFGAYLAGYVYELFYIYFMFRSSLNFVRLLTGKLDSKKRNKFKQTYILGIQMRLLTNFTQFTFIIINCLKYNYMQFYELTNSIEVSLQIFSNPSNQQSSSLDCLLLFFGTSAENVIYYKIIIALLLPFFKMGLTISLISIQISRGKVKYPTNVIAACISCLILLEQPGILTTLSLFCLCLFPEINGGFSALNTSISCSDLHYLSFRDNIVFAGIIFWSFIIPILLGCVLFWHKKDIETEHVRRRYGDLINSYRAKVFYWGLVIMIFKLGLLFALSFISQSPNAGILSLGMLYLYLALFNAAQPYSDPEFIKAEKYSIYGYLFTVFLLNLFFNTNDGWAQFISLLMIFGINLYLLCYHLSKLFVRIWRIYKGTGGSDSDRYLRESFASLLDPKEKEEAVKEDERRRSQTEIVKEDARVRMNTEILRENEHL